MTQIQGLNRVVNGVDRLIMGISGLALILMMLHITADVIANQVLSSPLPLTNATVTQYYMIAVAYLPLAAGELRGAHISVDLIVNSLPAAVRRWLDHLVQAACLLLYAALASQALQLAREKLANDAFLMEQATRVTTWPSYFIVPLGFALIALLLAIRLVCRLLGRPEPQPAETAPVTATPEPQHHV